MHILLFFFRLNRAKIPYPGGTTDRSEILLTCRSPRLPKIQEIKSISEPPLPIELYTIC